MSERRLVLVVGVGRSGTSLLSGILGRLGLHIPQPEVEADPTNPRGFGEPRWVVDFHWRLLRELEVEVNDARPSAWATVAGIAGDEAVRAELCEWLSGQLAEHSAIVVKDPRTSWFVPLWMRCADELGVAPDFATTLRHPAETVTSATRSYGNWLPTAARVGAWANVALETERLTRGARRVFIRYEDLLADWRHQLTRLAERLALPQLLPIDPALARDVDEFVDPSLYRNRVGWQELETPLPPGVREVVDAAWTRLQALAGPNADDPAALAALDAARAEYDRLYAEAEALAYTSIRPPRLKPAPAPALYVEVVRRIPVRYRRAIRRALHV